MVLEITKLESNIPQNPQELLEEIIDHEIIHTTGTNIHIDEKKFLPAYNLLLEQTIEKYRRVGWEIEKHDSQIEGVWYTFHPKNKPYEGE